MDTKTRNLLDQHGELITEALECYRRELDASRQRTADGAAECQDSWDKLKDDPAARAELDASRSLITSQGLRHMARVLAESAESYARQIATLDALIAALNPDYDTED
jgi:hypothetical protein